MAAEKGAVLIEKWIVCLDEKGYAAVLMDLSKALDTIMHKLLIILKALDTIMLNFRRVVLAKTIQKLF